VSVRSKAESGTGQWQKEIPFCPQKTLCHTNKALFLRRGTEARSGNPYEVSPGTWWMSQDFGF
jgi:hypothetical protein